MTRFDIGPRLTLLPSLTELVIAGWPSSSPSSASRDPRRLSICTVSVNNGSVLSCKPDVAAPVPHLPDVIAVSESTVLMPAVIPTARTTPPFSVPGVVRYDVKRRVYDGVQALSKGGERYPGVDRMYGDVDIKSGIACFLTTTASNTEDEDMTSTPSSSYDLFVHCFNVNASPQQQQTTTNMRVRKVVERVSSERTVLFSTVSVGSNGCVYIAYEQTVLRGHGLISEIFVHKLNATSITLDPVPWIQRNGQSIPRVIELPAIFINKTTTIAPSMIPSSIAQLIFLPSRRGGVHKTHYDDGLAVRLWTSLNTTGGYSIRHNRVVLNGSGRFRMGRQPQQWMVLLGRKRKPVVRSVPTGSMGSMTKSGSVPREWGVIEVGDTGLSKSGGKIVVFGLLVQNQPPWGSGPLFTYDIDVPYEHM